MKRQLKAMLSFFTADMRYSYYIFWTVFSAIILLSLGLTYLFSEATTIFNAVSTSVYIYGAILGFKTVKETLPFSLKMGGTRKNYFASIGLYFAGVSILSAIIESALYYLTTSITKTFSINMTLLHPAALLNQEDSFFYRFAADFVILFYLLTFFFIMGLIFYKYNIAVGFSVIGLIILALIGTAADGVLIELVKKIVIEASFTHYFATFGISIIMYMVSWLLLYNISAKSISS